MAQNYSFLGRLELFYGFYVQVIANAPKNEKAKSTKIPKKMRFIHIFVDKSFNPSGPVAAVKITPKVTYINIIEAP